jgi:outer membrane protein OmpA-like peptidoglycan-associated protein
MEQTLSDAQYDWTHDFCGIDPRASTPAPVAEPGSDEPSQEQQSQEQQPKEQQAQKQQPKDPWAAAHERQAKRDAYNDEYGIEKPAAPWAMKLPDMIFPREVVADQSVGTPERIGRGLAAVGAALVGHALDESPFDSRGDLQVPLIGLLREGPQEQAYQQARDEWEKEDKAIKSQRRPPAMPVPDTDHFFDIDDTALAYYGTASLDKFVGAYLGAGATEEAAIHGYASIDGEPDHNQKLSLDRAKAVADYLESQGIPKDRLKVVPHGETDAFSKSDAAQNRRVVISLKTRAAAQWGTLVNDN